MSIAVLCKNPHDIAKGCDIIFFRLTPTTEQWLTLAHLYHHQVHDYPKAIVAYRNFLTLQDDFLILKYLAEAYENNEDIEEACITYQQYLTHYPQDIEVWKLLVHFYMNDDKYREAKDAYRHLIQLLPTDDEILKRLWNDYGNLLDNNL